ncbi:hypothetical protein N8D56_05775 [Devosia sp. A8/3-2]|nr:hypothetical protein N8D56_05775 [Devosia sp. A8/3-2]
MIPELVGFGDIGIERGQLGGHGGDDAGAVGAGKGQDEIGRGHASLEFILPAVSMAWAAPSSRQ